MAKIIQFTPRKREGSALPAGHSAEILTLPVAKASAAPVDIIAEIKRMGWAR